MNEFYYARLSLKGHWSILHNSLPSLRLWSRESPYNFSLHLRQILVTHMFARSRVWLVASELEVHPSKCLVSYLRRLKRDLLWNEGVWWVSRVEGAIRGGGCHCCVLLACCTSLSSRPVAMANLLVARTASMFGVHFSGSDRLFPPK